MSHLTYLFLDMTFLLLATIVLVREKHDLKPTPMRLVVLAILLILTAVFDSIIIIAGIVAYDPANLLTLKIFVVPLEDFAYTIAAVIFIPMLWDRLGERRPTQHVDKD